MLLSIIATLVLGAGPETGADVGPFVRGLWLVQRYGTADALDPGNDQRVKGALAKAIGKDGSITLSKLGAFMEPDAFKRLAGSDERLGPDEIRRGRGVRRAGEPEAAAARDPGACRPAHDVVRHDRRAAPAGRPEAGRLDRGELPAGPAAGCRRRLHGQLPPEHPRGDDGQHRRGVLRDAGGPLPQRRHGPVGVQRPDGQGTSRRSASRSSRPARRRRGASRRPRIRSTASDGVRPAGRTSRLRGDRVLQALRRSRQSAGRASRP